MLAIDMIFVLGATAGVRCAMWYDLYPWARLLPRSPPIEVHDLSSRLGSSIAPKERWIASGMLAQWEHAVQVG